MVLMPLFGEAATTSWPPWRRMATVFEPIRPVPPITTIFMVDLPFSITGNPHRERTAPSSGVARKRPPATPVPALDIDRNPHKGRGYQSGAPPPERDRRLPCRGGAIPDRRP